MRKRTKDFIHNYGKVTFVFVSLLIILISVIVVYKLITPQKLRVSFFDVGQGDAIFIQTPSGKDMLIDGGPKNIILSRLSREMSYFDRDIDVVVATHPDADHVTGLIPVLEKYKISTVVVSPRNGDTQVFDDLDKHIDDEHADVRIAHMGDAIDFHDGVIVRVLYPEEKYIAKKNDTNESSISVLVTYDEQSFLLTGDLPIVKENKLFGSGLSSLRQRRESADSNITVYKAGHHGSKTSSGEQLLSYIRPEYTIISAGENNRYGHPSFEAIERIKKYTKEIISTIDRGSISFVTDGKMMEVNTSK